MTPTFRWVFLLAMVGRAASVPRPLVVDACALLCNPGAETESERERDPNLFPRYPKVNCKLQSGSDEHQSWIIASHCLKLCSYDLSISSEVNCFALRSSLGASLGCYCEALTPLSPNTMRLHESWRLDFLVKQLAEDIVTNILNSPLDTIILCELHEELFKNQTDTLAKGKLTDACVRDQTKVRRRRGAEKKTEQPDDPSPRQTERDTEEKTDQLDEPVPKLFSSCERDAEETTDETDNMVLEREERVTEEKTDQPQAKKQTDEDQDATVETSTDMPDIDELGKTLLVMNKMFSVVRDDSPELIKLPLDERPREPREILLNPNEGQDQNQNTEDSISEDKKCKEICTYTKTSENCNCELYAQS
ncbi:PREDICTED: uncharacterized protein LOC105564400 [Vollenhovia emeryi]|uniref:uncharacterized protein LOC105564400 n=1 Tax=Vollenhovia emeryi TaxID=411798 RepID=UPI0005F506D2|nr:PREDICTED: uncharacterized protein LOC105564400 [Vollenhovia emeryi]